MKSSYQFLNAVAVVALVTLSLAGELRAHQPIDIGSRRELFVGSFLIEKLQGHAGGFTGCAGRGAVRF